MRDLATIYLRCAETAWDREGRKISTQICRLHGTMSELARVASERRCMPVANYLVYNQGQKVWRW